MPSPYVSRIPEMRDNLVWLWRNERTDSDMALGAPWYPNANAIVWEWSARYSYSEATVACVIAAISPQCEWTRNLIIADDLLQGNHAPSIGGALNANIAKARAIRDDAATSIAGYFKSAPKVENFSLNLAGDYSVVTVDTHAAQAAMNDVTFTTGLSRAKYDCFATAYTLAAFDVNVMPATFQAVLWHTWKRKYPPADKRNARRQWDVIGEF